MRSAAFAWLKDRLARGAPRAFNALARIGLWEPLGGDEPDDQMRVFKRRQQPAHRGGLGADRRHPPRVVARRRPRAGRGSRVVYVPSRMEVSDRDWELTRLAYDMDEKPWDRGLVARRFAEIGASAGFPVLDLTPDLRAASRGVLGEPYFALRRPLERRRPSRRGGAIERFLRERGWAAAVRPAL